MQLTEHFESIFHEYLFAYRKFHSCPTALLALTEDWRSELDKHNIIATVAIDLSKAFDCLLHDLLLDKVNFCGLEKNSVSLLRSYLSSRYQRVTEEYFLHVDGCAYRSTTRVITRTAIV